MEFWEEFIKPTFPDMFQYDEASKQPKLTSTVHSKSTPTEKICMHKEIRSRVNSGTACYHSVQSL
jgi:hypothetical protein